VRMKPRDCPPLRVNECNGDLSTINACFPSCPRYLTVLLSGSHAYNFQGIDCSDRHEYLPVADEEIPVEGGYDAQFR